MAIVLKTYSISSNYQGRNYASKPVLWGELPLKDAIDLYNGGLYEYLQQEMSLLNAEIEKNAEEKKELMSLAKQLREAGIK